MKAILLALMLGLVVLTVPAAAQTNTAIVPGQSIGGIRIGGNVNDAVNELGTLVDRTDTRGGKHTVYDWPLRPHLVIAEKDTNRVVLILVAFTDVYRTDKGITGGSERGAVESAYGRDFTTDEDDASITLIYDSLGISFEVGKIRSMSGRVMAIIVYAPGTWKQVTEGL
ncbi:MAG TPA: hypothetical protein VGK88_06555 [bacterium]